MGASFLKCVDLWLTHVQFSPFDHPSYGDVSHATSDPRPSSFSACIIEKLGVSWRARLLFSGILFIEAEEVTFLYAS